MASSIGTRRPSRCSAVTSTTSRSSVPCGSGRSGRKPAWWACAQLRRHDQFGQGAADALRPRASRTCASALAFQSVMRPFGADGDEGVVRVIQDHADAMLLAARLGIEQRAGVCSFSLARVISVWVPMVRTRLAVGAARDGHAAAQYPAPAAVAAAHAELRLIGGAAALEVVVEGRQHARAVVVGWISSSKAAVLLASSCSS